MTTQEFSDMFTTLLNSYNTQAQFGEQASKREIVLDEYEKSVLLTQAQDLIVKSYFDRTLNNQGQGFDDSTRRQVDFSNLVKVEELAPYTSGTTTRYTDRKTVMWHDSTNGNIGFLTVNNLLDLTTPVWIRVEAGTHSSSIEANYSGSTLDVAIYPYYEGGAGIPWVNSSALVSAILNTSLTNYQDTKVSDYINIQLEDSSVPLSALSTNYNIFNETLQPAGSTETITTGYTSFDSRGVIFTLPHETKQIDGQDKEVSKVLFILNEKLVVDGMDYVIVPISYIEYDREMSKPYAQPLKKQAWRLFQNVTTGFDIYSELIPKHTLEGKSLTYRIRYVRRPKPIVLENMPNGLTVDGVSEQTGCELNPILHIDILNKAVELAIATRGGAAPNVNDNTNRG